MTAQEKITIQKLTERFDSYVDEDIKWKHDFDKWKYAVVEPLIKKEADKVVITEFLKKQGYYIAKVLTVAGICATIFKYFLMPVLGLK